MDFNIETNDLLEKKYRFDKNILSNNKYFIRLLEKSISLTVVEKKKILETMHNLSQKQIDELILIFRDEKEKYSTGYHEKVEDLKYRTSRDWMEIKYLLVIDSLSKKAIKDHLEKLKEIENKLLDGKDST